MTTIAPLEILFRPLARLLMHLGVGFQHSSEMLKKAYVEEAIKLTEPKPTDSAISLITGLHRRDVVRLRALETAPPLPANPLTRLIALWQADPNYSENGRPKSLPRRGDHSFDALARNVSKDIHPKSFLDQLLKIEAVKVKNDQVSLVSLAHIPYEEGEKLGYLASHIHDHLAASLANLESETPKFMERAAYYNYLTEEDYLTLKAYSEELFQDALQALNAKALSLQKPENEVAMFRLRSGVYIYAEKER